MAAPARSAMPPYLRRRHSRAWDWFIPREIGHLPWREKERLNEAAWEAARLHPRYRIMGRLLPLLGSLAMGLAALAMFLVAFGLLERTLLLNVIVLLFHLLFMVLIVNSFVWQRGRFREALRQKLLDGGIRPAFCF